MKKPLAIVAIVLLLGAGVGVWLVVKKSRPEKTPNRPPIAAIRIDSIDQSNRIVTLSDSGSRDPDGEVKAWRLAWGDGKEDNLSSAPQKAAHTYASEGDYTVSLRAVDNLGETSAPAERNITFDFQKRQKAQAAEAKREADRLKEEQARKAAEQEKELASEEARKARERQELEDKRRAEEELRKAKEAELASVAPPQSPLAAGLDDNSDSRRVIFTPLGNVLGEYQIFKEKTEGTNVNGKARVILAIRCVNFPDTPIVISKWQIDGKDLQLPVGRIRASLSPGQHDIKAFLTPKESGPIELKADVTVGPGGDCVVQPRK